jgi:hypothetical protein
MKTWKIITIAVLALAVSGATVASAYAYCWWGLGTTAPNKPYTVTTNPYIAAPPDGITTATPSTPTAPILTTTTPTQAPATTTTTPTQITPSTQTLAPIIQTNTQTPTLYTPPTTQITTPGYNTYGGWGGCMGRLGYGTTTPNTATTTATPLTIDQATQIATTYVTSLGNPDLKVTQVEEYTANFYVLVSERSTGYGAFELLINKYTGVVTPEMGPNMMWNTKYTFNTGYCNWFRGTTAAPTITLDQTKATAQQYLSGYLPGTTVGDVTTLYGYYTVEVLSAGNPFGMLSVNAYTGQVWYHTWHGAFVQEAIIA